LTVPSFGPSGGLIAYIQLSTSALHANPERHGRANARPGGLPFIETNIRDEAALDIGVQSSFWLQSVQLIATNHVAGLGIVQTASHGGMKLERQLL